MENLTDMRTPIMEALYRFYRELDQAVSILLARHGSRLTCAYGCTVCCMDGLTIFEVEAENIRQHCPDVLLREAPHAEGGCPFLDAAGGCRIYNHRPYVCRTQGLPLRWIDETEDGSLVELRDICPVNEAGPAIETLPEDACWEIGPYESRLAQLQAELDGGRLKRILLRDLFSRHD